MDRFKLPNGIEILSLARRTAGVRMRMAFGASYAVPQPAADVIAAMASLAKKKQQLQEGAEDPSAITFEDINPTEADYIFPQFRALSAELVSGYFLDFTKKGVLEAAAPLMLGQTIYKNHRYYDVEGWIGSVSLSEWDAKGEKSSGVPGINVEMKIDWKMNPKIARGLLMKPPAIHSCSATIEFEWDASHPELLEKGIFWQSLGEEVDGEIVRIIITNIISFWELSLVFQGADRHAKQLPGDEEEELERRGDAETLKLAKPNPVTPLKKENTVKLTAEQKKIFGLEAHTEEDVADAIVIGAGQQLSTALISATSERDALLGAARAECLRVATLAVGVTKEGVTEPTLPEAIANIINNASAKDLQGLTAVYTEQAAAKFQSTCRKCGSHEISEGRSSVDDTEVAGAGKSPVFDTSIL